MFNIWDSRYITTR